VVSGGIPAASVRRLNLRVVGENLDGLEDAARAAYEAKYTAERNYTLLMGVYQRGLASHG
jgi:hypothetical protein